MFTHVIMTRFNMASPGREASLRSQPGWLEGRFDLFERYCLPSIAAQTERRFEWVIYFDDQTPEPFRDHISRLQKIHPFIAHYTPYFDASGWIKSVTALTGAPTPALLTTRLDSDDALSSDFCTLLRAAVSSHNHQSGAYNFPRGLIRRGNAMYELRHNKNPFFSLLTPWNETAQTALNIQHMKLQDSGPVFQVEAPPTWMQIVHGGNVSNRVRGTRVSPETLPERFAGEGAQNLDPARPLTLTLEKALLAPLRALRDGLVQLVNRARGRS